MSNGMPGVSSLRTATPRKVLVSDQAILYVPGGVVIDGAKSRDPLNTDRIDILRPGMLMGKITSGGKYAPSVIGLTGAAYNGSTTVTVSVATAIELVRRVGTTGTFKLTGPPTAAGVVRTVTVTYSAVDTATGAITVTALNASDVWTLTAPAGTDAGDYRLRVTAGGVTDITDALAFNADTATVDAALEALDSVGTAGVAAVYNAGVLTLTFASALGPVEVEVVNDATIDSPVWEGGWIAVHTTTGVDGRFVTASLVQPTDGSETPRVLIADNRDAYGIKVTDVNDANQDTQFPQPVCGGFVDASQIVNYPADASTSAWLKAQLNARGVFVFDDEF